ncbi:MAG: 23S rRNA (pseudouridine(1915)-N(3))-methyltransferase RlmH [Candidatus Adiutrix sp.]|nr:23S rRNA (pseudouridine(1915)-N(3))-methyltransferase RlmH [Candidatus Adiutrix sp.]
MKLNFLFPGKTREPYLAEGIKIYLQRLRPMVEVREHILKSPAPPGPGSAAEALARARESSLLLERCGAGEHLLASDLAGERLSSTDLADRLEAMRLGGVKALNLVVGGPWGLDEALLARANLRLSLGPMTFPHELARLILLEQVYRAYTIIRHLPYHKGSPEKAKAKAGG